MTIKSCAVNSLKLHNFRNYTSCHIESVGRSVLLAGHNGAGKTSLLEAISCFTPGRNMRGSLADDMKHKGIFNWAVNLNADMNGVSSSLSTGLVDSKNITKKVYKIDNEYVKSSTDFIDKIRMLWLTPQIDSFFLSSSQNRRKFLDRIAYNFNTHHAKCINNYDKKLKERLIILKMPILDDKWLDIIESDLADLNIEITKNRLYVLDLLTKQMNMYTGAFPKSKLFLDCDSTELFKDKDLVLKKYFSNRKIDKLSGRTNFGCHKADIKMLHFDTDRSFSICSTGEQKAMIMGLILFQAIAINNMDMPMPILLLDEIMTHLDEERRIAFSETVREIGVQCWITSTHIDFWKEVKFPANFYIVENAGITPINRVD